MQDFEPRADIFTILQYWQRAAPSGQTDRGPRGIEGSQVAEVAGFVSGIPVPHDLVDGLQKVRDDNLVGKFVYAYPLKA